MPTFLASLVPTRWTLARPVARLTRASLGGRPSTRLRRGTSAILAARALTLSASRALSAHGRYWQKQHDKQGDDSRSSHMREPA